MRLGVWLYILEAFSCSCGIRILDVIPLFSMFLGTSYLDFLGNSRKTIFCFYLNSRVFCSFSIMYGTFGTCVLITRFLISENYFNIAENMIKQNVIFTRLE